MSTASSVRKTTFALVRHDTTHCDAVLQLTATLTRLDVEWLHLSYRLSGDCPSVLLPPHNNTLRPACGLWRHTCFEAFVANVDGTGYHEFNFSPCGNWAAYAFSAPRQRVANCSADWQPRISTRTTFRQFSLAAVTPLPPPVRHAGVAVGLSAVLEHVDGRRCYWALAHPCDDPDFHARSGWLATLPPA